MDVWIGGEKDPPPPALQLYSQTIDFSSEGV
jgi:hypothetical protein